MAILAQIATMAVQVGAMVQIIMIMEIIVIIQEIPVEVATQIHAQETTIMA